MLQLSEYNFVGDEGSGKCTYNLCYETSNSTVYGTVNMSKWIPPRTSCKTPLEIKRIPVTRLENDVWLCHLQCWVVRVTPQKGLVSQTSQKQ